jgi:hypothetical protein
LRAALKNEAFLAKGRFASNISSESRTARQCPSASPAPNAKRSAVKTRLCRSEASYGPCRAHHRHDRARIKIDMANLTYNFPRLAWLEGRTAPA